MMPRELPLFLAIRRPSVERRDGLVLLVTRALRPPASEAGVAVHSFAFKSDERHFARELLRRKSNLWVFRSNQRLACGDFVIVDVSSPTPARRRAYVIDLKQGAPIRLGGGGAGVQLRNADHIIRALEEAGVLGAEAVYELVTGDSQALLGFFGATTAASPASSLQLNA
jgi:hypothetical protein